MLFKILFIFAVGSLAGWLLELFYRSLFSQKTLVNPGFLSGPWLPIYGSGLTVLFLLSGIEMPLWLRIPFFMILTSLIEYLTGIFFLRIFNLRLWDYRNQKINFQGLVCPRFTIYWTILATLFYLFLYPLIITLHGLIHESIWFYFSIGIFCGLTTMDALVSFEIALRLRKIINEISERERKRLALLKRKFHSVDLKTFKDQLHNKAKDRRSGSILSRFLNPFSNFKQSDLTEQVEIYMQNFKDKRNRRRRRK